jgi:hypothetical protein
LIFDKGPDFFGMMDAAVVEDENTSWSGIRICERDLCKIRKTIGMDKPTLTTYSSRNLMRRSVFTEPSTILCATIPSSVRTGRME